MYLVANILCGEIKRDRIRILQNLARELAPVLHYIFDQSLNSGDLPADWTLANVAPIFKKAVNYRPVSLTCITCKLFEHIVCKHMIY